MIEAGIACLIAGVVLAILAISFAVDVSQGVGPGAAVATVDSQDDPQYPNRPRRTYTFLRVESKGLAVFITVLTFLLAGGSIIAGIVLLAMHHH